MSLHMQRQVPAHVGHGADAVNAGHVGDLVGIGHDCGDAAWHDCRCKVGRRAETAFDMNVGVDQARRNVGAAEIDGFQRSCSCGRCRR